jgi:hypothetical protein
MANALYDVGRQNFLEADIDWLANDIKVVSYDESDDPVDLVNDDALDDILAAAREFTSGNLASKTSSLGVADAADLTPAFTSASGDIFDSITLYYDSGVASTSLLICNIDTATGLPLTPDGGNIDITWSSGANKIFKL